jgi:hypothetical protein
VRDRDCSCHTRGRTFIHLPLAVTRWRTTQWALELPL